MFSLYKITNLVNGKFYIGVTSRDIAIRFNEHLSTAKCTKIQSHFYRAMRKHGRKGFSIELIFEVDDRVQAMEAEVKLIAEMKPHYNSTLGGDGTAGHVLSEEAKERIAKVHRGNKYCLGKKHSEHTKSVLRDLGFAKREEWLKRSHVGPEALSKVVVCLNDGAVYPSASAAARAYGLSKSIVIEICLRNPRRLMADKKVFRYFGDHFGGIEEVELIKKEHFKRKAAGHKKLQRSVVCVSTGSVYESATQAANAYGLSRQFVQEICLGKKKTKNGLEFLYTD